MSFRGLIRNATTRISQVRVNGLAVIGSVCAVLALATASECHSITHLPSLLYGVVLWGWWGCIAGTLWTLGPRMPAIMRFSPAGVLVHVLAGCTLGVIHLLLLGSLGF